MGLLTAKIAPKLAIGPPAMAVVGMATMIGSATGAVLTAIVMLFEMTRDYNVVLPVIGAVAIANAGAIESVRRRSTRSNSLRRGHVVPDGRFIRS